MPELNEGNLPPQDLLAEQAVLGAMLIDKSCIDRVMAILKPESFYCKEHGMIYAAISDLALANKAVDIITVTEELRKRKQIDEVGGPVYITGLSTDVYSGSHAEQHAAIIQDKFMSREILRSAAEAQAKVYDHEDVLDIISALQDNLTNVLSDNTSGNVESIKRLVGPHVKQMEENSKNGNEISGISTGLSKLDRSTGGWQDQDLIIVAARPSQGKTALSLHFAFSAAMKKKRVAFFSLEMSKSQILDRIFSAITNISPLRLRTGRIYDQEWELIDNQAVRTLENIELLIDDSPALSLPQLKSKIMQVRKNKIELVIVDYLQLMKGNGDNREQEISSISRGLKAIAKELNVPVIALSQLNRAADGKRPILSNLRESGAIEQDADIVIFIHRPEKYGQEMDETGRSTRGLVELLIEKHRNGPTGMVECYINEFCTQFTDEPPTETRPADPVKNYYETEKPAF